MLNREGCILNKKLLEEFQPWVNPVLAHMLARIYGEKNKIVIDMGAGPGMLAMEMAKRMDSTIYAVDYNPEMLVLADEYFKSQKAENIFPILDDVHHLAFPDDFADLIVSYTCFHHWQDPVRGLRECHRVLKPGGAIVIIDTQPVAEEIVDILRTKVNDPAVFSLISKAIQESYSIPEIQTFVESAGFDNYTLGSFSFELEDLVGCIELIDESLLLDEPLENVSTNWQLVVKKAPLFPRRQAGIVCDMLATGG